MSNFDKKYVNTNIKPGSPEFDPIILDQLLGELVRDAAELEDIKYSILAAVAIGAHRADFVPKLFEKAIAEAKNEEQIKIIFFQIRSTVMVIWSFVGIPWCVPALLGLVNVLRTNGLEKFAEGRTRPDIRPEDRDSGLNLLEKTYNGVQNNEVQDWMKTYFADFTDFTWTVVFGYSLAGTTATGIFKEHQSQLLLAVAIAASGATRQARSHGKGALGLGNSTAALATVFKVAEDLNKWNKNDVAHIDVNELANELNSAVKQNLG